MKILSNVKQQWDAATSCCSSCWTRLSVTPKSSRLKWLILLSPALTLPLLLSPLSGAPTPKTSSRKLQLSDYLEIISTVQCSSRGNGTITLKQSALLTRRVVDRMKQQQLISPNATVSCTCTRCELTETDTQTTHYWTFLEGVVNIKSPNS